ncbi:DRTGG domain-containing protein [Enterococcus columbae]|uniref:CBS domain-containing protein n=1 Tax=Enterococcus columbae DSM 7374 = ATCC 51263 TaxID=1121865 RepID=S1N4J1_9ENTE|nr:DRTGG domain-containing protein [Enterococcus columbae]EOT41986.1 CBS domain-containing protein [Enterococcus columbae DSM 7374 = ATCC 51263]EOW80543.1 CBS domain-containing protein [Enterococcus columbae DSM 7374 = ATCC 51263]OJG26382.1 CBS domain-containing protein [Enterococcus columbae DSM 7374 = ATCC 51263]
MATKHDIILSYIEQLPVGEKISVRGIAKELGVSEGTAYRAIKEAETIGLVSTIQRVGTIRIEKKLKKNIEKLTFAEVVEIIEGDVLGGATGLSHVLNKFVIGAMEVSAIERYVTPGSLMIVGNRVNVQKLALENGAAVLITGGFDTTKEIADLADKYELPILRTTYDTFTVATMINRALSDQLIKKEIMLISDIYMPLEKTNYLTINDTVRDYLALAEETSHSRFPVVNKNMRVVGIVTTKDILEKADHLSIERVMTKEPRVVKKEMSIASVSHQMIWDGLEVMPVVADDLSLLGIVTRQDIMKAMHLVQRQPQVSDTIADQVNAQIHMIEEDYEGNPLELPHFQFTVTPQMVDELGTISFGVLSGLIANTAKQTMMLHKRKNTWIEQVNLHYFKLIQLESELLIKPRILEFGRRSAKLDLEVFLENMLVAKAIITCQIMERA